MSTRSSITAKCEDGKFRSIYCHFDGYPSNVGEILQNYFSDQEKIEQLLALGDLSSLAPSIEAPDGHTYDNRIEGHTVAYHRDRGEDKEDTKCFVGETLKSCQNNQAYNYYWDGKQWFVHGCGSKSQDRSPLKIVLQDE